MARASAASIAAARRVPEPRGDIAVRPQQIAGAGRGIVALPEQSRRVAKTVIADPDEADAVGDTGRRAIGKLQQREFFPALTKASVRNVGLPSRPVSGASGIDAPGRGPPRQVSLSAVESGVS